MFKPTKNPNTLTNNKKEDQIQLTLTQMDYFHKKKRMTKRKTNTHNDNDGDGNETAAVTPDRQWEDRCKEKKHNKKDISSDDEDDDEDDDESTIEDLDRSKFVYVPSFSNPNDYPWPKRVKLQQFDERFHFSNDNEDARVRHSAGLKREMFYFKNNRSRKYIQAIRPFSRFQKSKRIPSGIFW